MRTTENRSQYDRSKLRYPSDLSDEEWAVIKPLIPPAKSGGNKRTVDEREIVNDLTFILSTGCQWASLPTDLPPRSAVNYYFCRWNYDRTLDRVHHALCVQYLELAGREASPTAAIATRRRVADIDSQSVKSTTKGGSRTGMVTMRGRKSGARIGTSSSISRVC